MSITKERKEGYQLLISAYSFLTGKNLQTLTDCIEATNMPAVVKPNITSKQALVYSVNKQKVYYALSVARLNLINFFKDNNFINAELN